MKKLLLVVTVCVAALAAIPVSSASAAAGEVAGCTFSGTAKLTPELKTLPETVAYTFGPTEVGKCEVGGKFESAEAKGTGLLACPAGAAVAGEGFIKAGGIKHEFEITLAAAAGVVEFVLLPKGVGGVAGGGVATFLTSVPSDVACFVEGKAATLKFEGAAAGVSTS
jgi:hypothetical protein